MKTGIVIAMSSERKRLIDLLDQPSERSAGPFTYTEGTIGANAVALMQCGIGKVNAAAGTVELIRRFHPDCIVSTGVAGGIDTCLQVMDVVVGREVAYHDVWCGEGNEYGQVQGLPAAFPGNGTLLQTALSLETSTPLHEGLIVTGDRFVTERWELDVIKEKFPAGLAVDMESAAIAQVCHLYRVPFVSFRIVSDIPGVENHTAQYRNFWSEMAERSFRVTKTFLEAIPERLPAASSGSEV